jgi:hypothetical protein
VEKEPAAMRETGERVKSWAEGPGEYGSPKDSVRLDAAIVDTQVKTSGFNKVVFGIDISFRRTWGKYGKDPEIVVSKYETAFPDAQVWDVRLIGNEYFLYPTPVGKGRAQNIFKRLEEGPWPQLRLRRRQ